MHLRSNIFTDLVGEEWHEDDQLVQLFQQAMVDAFAKFEIAVQQEYVETVVNVFEAWLDDGIIETDGDEYTGRYLRLNKSRMLGAINEFRGIDPAAQRVEKLGREAYLRALRKVAEEDGLLTGPTGSEDIERAATANIDSLDVAPASDRTVHFNHNEVSEIDERTAEIIDSVESLNVVDGEHGLREILLGQLRAGRELIRAGAFKLYALEVTLIEGLKFLAKRYEHQAVGALAASLITALALYLGIPQ